MRHSKLNILFIILHVNNKTLYLQWSSRSRKNYHPARIDILSNFFNLSIENYVVKYNEGSVHYRNLKIIRVSS